MFPTRISDILHLKSLSENNPYSFSCQADTPVAVYLIGVYGEIVHLARVESFAIVS